MLMWNGLTTASDTERGYFLHVKRKRAGKGGPSVNALCLLCISPSRASAAEACQSDTKYAIATVGGLFRIRPAI